MKRRVTYRLLLNKILDIIKLNVEGMPKAEVGWNLDLLHKTVSHFESEEKFLEEN